jgi:1-acyl-sn-glycerol-3-phosphate acyltransferase
MLKQIFFFLFVRPVILLISGVYLRGENRLPKEGPCIIAANHNSHIDTMVLMSLFPLSTIKRVRPIAAADYFLKNRFFAWFSLTLIGIIPLNRRLKKSEGHPFAAVEEALKQGDIVIVFPEGSRGEAEKMIPFKTGISHLAESFKEVPVVPVFIHGAGKCLPKGEALFVPFVIDVSVAESIYHEGESHKEFTSKLENSIKSLQEKI